MEDQTPDTCLLTKATERMEKFDPSMLIFQEAVDAEFGFTKENLSAIGEIEFE